MNNIYDFVTLNQYLAAWHQLPKIRLVFYLAWICYYARLEFEEQVNVLTIFQDALGEIILGYEYIFIKLS